MKRIKLEFELSHTQEEFVFSDAVVNALISNTGEGKTFASFVSLMVHAKRCGRAIRAAIVRDTHTNIKMQLVPSILEDFGAMVRFYDDYKLMRIFSNPPVDAWLLGIDDENALNKLQGPEFACIWLEEPAPLKDRQNAGLSEEVFKVALVRCTRQKGTQARLQISMNPADKSHWTYKRLIQDPVIDPDNPLITRKVWFIPYGENPHVSEVSRQAVKAAYKNDPAAYLRYVKGEFAPVYAGKRAAPDFVRDVHVAKDYLKPAPGLVSVRGWDGWHNPVSILAQITPAGRLVFLDVCHLERGGDVRGLITSKVMPLLNSPRWKDVAKVWRDVGDFSMRQPDQSNRNMSAADVIERAFGTSFERGPSKWDNIKRGVGRAFNTNIEGRPAIIIDPRLEFLISGLEGLWHYKTDLSGNITNPLPVKNEVSHVCDAFANVCNVCLPEMTFENNLGLYRQMNLGARRRTSTYAVGGRVRWPV